MRDEIKIVFDAKTGVYYVVEYDSVDTTDTFILLETKDKKEAEARLVA